MKPFETARSDGRSDRQVVFEFTRDALPETLFKYEDLIRVLQIGVSTKITRPKVYAAVGGANVNLLRESQRVLSVVKNVGYRTVRANEHLGLAVRQKDRAEIRIKRGIDILKGTRLDELDEPHRSLHQGQLMIMGGFYDAIRQTQRKQAAQDKVIQQLIGRVNQLEHYDVSRESARQPEEVSQK